MPVPIYALRVVPSMVPTIDKESLFNSKVVEMTNIKKNNANKIKVTLRKFKLILNFFFNNIFSFIYLFEIQLLSYR